MWRRFDNWWREDCTTVCNGFFFMAVTSWVFLIINGIAVLVRLLV